MLMMSKKLPSATHLSFSRTKLPCASYFGVTNWWEAIIFLRSSTLVRFINIDDLLHLIKNRRDYGVLSKPVGLLKSLSD